MQDKENFVNFWRCLCICHDVIQTKDLETGEMSLSGASQDEVTFLEMCKATGFAYFIERQADKVRICVDGNEEEYQILRVIEFTSDRKRMSVIVRRSSDN